MGNGEVGCSTWYFDGWGLRCVREGGLLLSSQWHAVSSIKHSKHIHGVLCASSDPTRQNTDKMSEARKTECVCNWPQGSNFKPMNAFIPELFQNYCVVVRPNKQFVEVYFVLAGVKRHFVPSHIPWGGVPANPKTGLCWLWSLEVSRTLERWH